METYLFLNTLFIDALRQKQRVCCRFVVLSCGCRKDLEQMKSCFLERLESRRNFALRKQNKKIIIKKMNTKVYFKNSTKAIAAFMFATMLVTGVHCVFGRLQ